MSFIWYACPLCGKPDSSDGENFCGECNAKRAEINERIRADRRANRKPCRSEGCEGYHCRNCGCHIVGPGNECDQCFGI